MKDVCKTMFVSIIVNIILVVIKFVIGVISNYKSLVADAIHSLSDLSTDVVAIFGEWLASKKADKDHPYGHGKIEYITGIIIGAFIMAVGLGMIYTGIGAQIVEQHHRVAALIVAFITMAMKYGLAIYVRTVGKKINNSILIASAEENMSGVLSAISVFITIILSMFVDVAPIFKYADKVGCLIVSLLIIKTAFNVLKENMIAVIGESETNEEIIDSIKGIIMSIKEVMSIDNLVVMKYGSYYQIDLAASIDPSCDLEEADSIAHEIKKKLLRSKMRVKYAIVRITPYKKSKSKR